MTDHYRESTKLSYESIRVGNISETQSAQVIKLCESAEQKRLDTRNALRKCQFLRYFKLRKEWHLLLSKAKTILDESEKALAASKDLLNQAQVKSQKGDEEV